LKSIATRITAFAATLLALVALAGSAHAAPPKKTTYDVPTITCGSSTQASINIQVCAGASGAPAGFSIQWIDAPTFYGVLGGVWPSSSSGSICAASFSGNASLSRYNLGANACVTINVGEFLFDNGASVDPSGPLCLNALMCGTSYVFRVFAHGTSTLAKSAWSGTLTCSTLPCGNQDGGCTLTQGYWKTHNDTVCAVDPTSPLCVAWPVTSLTLGTVTYDQSQLLAIFNTSAGGNGLIALAHQLIAAKLNIANGADGTAVMQAIMDADTLIAGLVVPPVGSGYLAPGTTSALITTLTNFNEGAIGPGHCP
jgi:hypothetical protein